MVVGFGGFVYYGVQLNVENLDFNLYFTVATNALMEILAVIVGSFLLCLTDRRLLFSSSSVIAGVSSILCINFAKKKSAHSWAQLGLETVGFMAASMAYDILFIYCAELFPTNIRNFGVSLLGQTLMLGGAVAPLLVVLGRLSPAPSFVVFGGFAIFSGILIVWLPDTRNVQLSGSAMKETPLKLSYVYQCVSCDSFHLQFLGRTFTKNNNVRYAPAFGPIVDKECGECGSKFIIGGPISSALIHNHEWVVSILSNVEIMKERYPAYDRVSVVLASISEVERQKLKDQPSNQPRVAILSKEPTIEANFAKAIGVVSKAQASSIARFLPKPERNCGPKIKAQRKIIPLNHASLLGPENIKMNRVFPEENRVKCRKEGDDVFAELS
ncbi:hypothetical protein J5N97_021858 [Dioscorea zingiberensis]|uniref:tRNA (guanine(26)-N(2))-dimethyltransferase n=1 Tax=Dioscorea zingiberensis TaxID=325984 RepID=A0A9D5C958_9LILI|nr:hypothetical protein J5N97_021858 [Dioscorea zingiberensis]